MEKFYHKLRDKIKAAPDQSTDWALWEDIQHQLDSPKSKTKPFWLLWFIPVIAASLLFYQLGKNSNTSNPGVTQNETVQKNGFITNTTDTIYIEKNTVLIDTLYIEKLVVSPSANSNSLLATQREKNQAEKNINLALNNKIHQLQTQLNLLRQPKPTTSFTEEVVEEINLNLKTKANNNQISTSRIDVTSTVPQIISFVKYQRNLRPYYGIYNQTIETKTPSLLDRLVPDYYNLGFKLSAPQLTNSAQLGTGPAIGFGLQGAALFSPRIQLIAGLQFISINNKISDPSVISLFPQPAGVPSEADLQYLKVSQELVQIPLQLKTIIARPSYGQFYILGGLGLRKIRKAEYNFEYDYLGNELYLETKSNAQNWHLATTELGLGLELNHGLKWSSFLELGGAYNFNKPLSQIDKLHTYGLSFGLMYKL